jgi:hypothetical protein
VGLSRKNVDYAALPVNPHINMERYVCERERGVRGRERLK